MVISIFSIHRKKEKKGGKSLRSANQEWIYILLLLVVLMSMRTMRIIVYRLKIVADDMEDNVATWTTMFECLAQVLSIFHKVMHFSIKNMS